jgi:hypothetical protein
MAKKINYKKAQNTAAINERLKKKENRLKSKGRNQEQKN